MDEWIKLESKDILDSDGFWTEYTLYTDGQCFVCVFGDSEIYGPEDFGNWDFETKSEEEAYEWFEDFEVDELIDDEELVLQRTYAY